MITSWRDTWGQLRDEVDAAFLFAQQGTVGAEAGIRLKAFMDTYNLTLGEIVQEDIPLSGSWSSRRIRCSLPLSLPFTAVRLARFT